MCGDQLFIAQVNQQFDDFIRILPQDACLLGAPLSNGRASGLAISRLKTLPTHAALVLLRSAFSATCLMHTHWHTPCHGLQVLQNFDNLLRDVVSIITNSSLMDPQWIQANLPIRNGGLAIGRGTSLALSVFLASTASRNKCKRTEYELELKQI